MYCTQRFCVLHFLSSSNSILFGVFWWAFSRFCKFNDMGGLKSMFVILCQGRREDSWYLVQRYEKETFKEAEELAKRFVSKNMLRRASIEQVRCVEKSSKIETIVKLISDEISRLAKENKCYNLKDETESLVACVNSGILSGLNQALGIIFFVSNKR